MKRISLSLLLFLASAFAQDKSEISKSYSKFDFIPGNEMVCFNNFEGEAKDYN